MPTNEVNIIKVYRNKEHKDNYLYMYDESLMPIIKSTRHIHLAIRDFKRIEETIMSSICYKNEFEDYEIIEFEKIEK